MRVTQEVCPAMPTKVTAKSNHDIFDRLDVKIALYKTEARFDLQYGIDKLPLINQLLVTLLRTGSKSTFQLGGSPRIY